MNKIDDMLWKLRFDKPRPNLPFTNEEGEIRVAKSQLKQAILEGLPEKKEDLCNMGRSHVWEEFATDSGAETFCRNCFIYRVGVLGREQGYKEALDDITQSIEKLFEGKEGK